MQTIIMHLDMNSYFASVEQQDNLQWRGKPVGVCEHLGGIIIGASVEAKRWGITTGTPVWEARKLYPKIILTQTHPDRYRFYTKRLIKIVSDYTDKVEVYSIDEVFLDITKSCNIKIPNDKSQMTNKFHPPVGGSSSKISEQEWVNVDPFNEAVNIAKEIKRRMKTEMGDWLRCSVGIAWNKMVAKAASEMQKPDGLVVVKNGAANNASNGHHCAAQWCPLYFSKDELYHRLKLTDIPGIGKRQEKNLNALGIRTLLDLKNYPKSHLVSVFGTVAGNHLYNMGQLEGSFKAEVAADDNIKSIGHMYTLPAEFRKPKFFVPVLYKLSEMVGRRMRRQELTGNAVHFFLGFGNHEYFGKSRRLKDYVYEGREIFLECMDIFESSMLSGRGGSRPSPTGEFKLIGVTVAGLVPFVNQLSLFGTEEKKRRIAAALDEVNEKYGDFTVCRVPVLAAGKVFRDSVGFGRIKELN